MSAQKKERDFYIIFFFLLRMRRCEQSNTGDENLKKNGGKVLFFFLMRVEFSFCGDASRVVFFSSYFFALRFCCGIERLRIYLKIFQSTFIFIHIFKYIII